MPVIPETRGGWYMSVIPETHGGWYMPVIPETRGGWYMPVIPALGRQRQEGQELGWILSSRVASSKKKRK